MNKNTYINKRKYFAVTLVETLLYLALTSSMILVITGTFNSYLKTRTRAIVRSEVDSQATYAINRINYYLKNAESVSAPTNLASGTQLSFVKSGSVTTSTLTITSGQLQINTAGNIEIITSNRLTISNLQVHNRAPVGEPPIVSYSFTASYRGGVGAEFVYSSAYQSTVLVNSY